MYRFTVPGEPMGKGRPRVTKHGSYTPIDTQNYEALVKQMFSIRYPGNDPVRDVPLSVKICAYFSVPASAPVKKKQAMLEGMIRPTKRPDIDNIAKIITDALNKIAYHDDAQIVDIKVEKYYSLTPRVEIRIERWDSGD
jgi:Holliday junction resolvase RusA-like endonuclease